MTDHDERESGAGDEVEMRVEGVREPGGDAGYSDAAPVSPRRNRFRALRLALYAIAFVAVLVAVIAAIARPQIGGIGAVAYPTPTLVQGTPPTPGPPPRSCTPAAPWPSYVSKESGSFGGAIGASPVWAVGFDGPQANKLLRGYSRYGWMTFVDFYVEPGVTAQVIVSGERLSDSVPMWISVSDVRETNFGQRAPSVRVILNPQERGLPVYDNLSRGIGEDWALWSGVLYLPAAGCYALEASWPGGSWRVTFAAGL